MFIYRASYSNNKGRFKVLTKTKLQEHTLINWDQINLTDHHSNHNYLLIIYPLSHTHTRWSTQRKPQGSAT